MTEAILLCRCFSMCLHTLRAVRVWLHAFERIKSGECACICLRVCIVWHLSAFIESWWSIFKCWPVSRAERVYTCFCIYRELDMCVHLLVRIWGWRGDHHVWASIKRWASMCMSQRLWRCCYFFLRMHQSVLRFLRMHQSVLRAERVFACVFHDSRACKFRRVSRAQHVLARVGAVVEDSRAGYATSCVCMCQKAGSCYIEWCI
jgi:hypothetical protein